MLAYCMTSSSSAGILSYFITVHAIFSHPLVDLEYFLQLFKYNYIIHKLITDEMFTCGRAFSAGMPMPPDCVRFPAQPHSYHYRPRRRRDDMFGNVRPYVSTLMLLYMCIKYAYKNIYDNQSKVFVRIYNLLLFWQVALLRSIMLLILYEIWLQEADAGDYTCVATNDAGSSEGTATLTVRSKYLSNYQLWVFYVGMKNPGYRCPSCVQSFVFRLPENRYNNKKHTCTTWTLLFIGTKVTAAGISGCSRNTCLSVFFSNIKNAAVQLS